MKTLSVGFIGGGRVTKIFLKAFSNKNEDFRSVKVYDTNSEVLALLKNQFPSIITVDTASSAAKQDILFIALHPPVIMDALNQIKDDVTASTTVISLAPKISIEKIRSILSKGQKVIRLIPNATSYINEGYNPFCLSSGFQSSEVTVMKNLMEILGNTFEVMEHKLEAYAIMSAMLPTYFWFQWKELQDIANKIGLDEKESAESVRETIIASAKLMYDSGLEAGEVMDLIPVKPIAEHESQIKECLRNKLLPLFEKIKP